ncbi:MAG TPA: SDR family oxidoreductase [Trebonia sp.]|nr:SDR family oxidoreductase [Trebonia sp.]
MSATTGGISGQRILVVGASSGIGRGLAVELAARGASVAASARRAGRLSELPGIVPLPCDVTSAAAVNAMVEAAAERLGGLDALVYTAGLSRINPLHEASLDDWAELFAPNVFGAGVVTRAALAHLLAAGSQGRAVYLTSDSAEKPYPGLVLYCSAKAALSAYALGLASEFPALKVTEVVVGPTAGTEVANHFEPGAFGEWASRWFDEGYVRYEMLQVADVVQMIVDTLGAETPPARLRATGALAAPTLEEAQEAAGPGQPSLGSAVAGDRS